MTTFNDRRHRSGDDCDCDRCRNYGSDEAPQAALNDRHTCEFEDSTLCDQPAHWACDIGGGFTFLCAAHKDECEQFNRAHQIEEPVEYVALKNGGAK